LYKYNDFPAHFAPHHQHQLPIQTNRYPFSTSRRFCFSHSQSKKKHPVKMQFFSIIAFSMISTLAIAAPVADPAPAADAAAKQDLVDFWQDA
jgi:hypothetical protein